jgi:glycosyltransferase involved in cell wall biosynthesis
MLFGLVPRGHGIHFPNLGPSGTIGPGGFCVLAPPARVAGVEGLRGGDYQFWLRLHIQQKSREDHRQACSENASLPVLGLRAVEAIRREISELSFSASSQRSRLVTQLAQKEAVTRELAHALDAERAQSARVAEIHRELVAKEIVIQELSTALSALRASRGIRGRFPVRQLRRAWAELRGRIGLNPRLGALYQHSPRPLMLPPGRPPLRPSTLPAVTLVTPSYRQGEFIERTILSVLGQEYPKLQYIIQDGGSDDQTREILSVYSGRLARCRSERDSGQSQAINRGFADTDGEIMGWLNSDDVLLPGALSRVVAVFLKNPDIDVVYGNRVIIDRRDRQVGRWILPGHDGAVLSWADFIPQESLFWRRRIWDRVGARIDETFRFAMDWDLLIRFRAVGARFMHVPHVLGAFRVHRGQKTDGTMEQIGHQEMSRIRYSIHGRVPSDLEVNQHLRSFMRRHVAADLRYGAVRRLTKAWWRPIIWPSIVGGSL